MDQKSILTEDVKQKWDAVINADGVDAITDRTIRNNTIRLLENTVNALAENDTTTVGSIATVSNNQASSAGYDPVLISMVRRAMPVLVANDIMGVQPMSGPTGLVFAMNASRYTQPGGTPEATWDGSGYVLPANGDYSTAQGEALGVGLDASVLANPVPQSNPWKEVSFDISKTSVTARTRALKSRYSQELAQDLRAVHGLDAETELASLMSSEIITEINREMVDLVNTKALPGCQQADLDAAGTFSCSTDTDARWQMEAYKALYFQIEREANLIGRMTGRGRGNIIITSPDIASALEASQKLDLAPLGGSIVGGWTGISYAGVLNGKYKVFIDPYAATDYITIGYKGANVYDNGLFYCPYVPLQMLKATGEEDFAPRLGFKTRYGLVANPFAGGVAYGTDTGADASNQYYRTFQVVDLMGTMAAVVNEESP